MEIAYWEIGWMSAKDGPGNRVVVYMQGCPVSCPWCHSPHARYDTSPLLVHKQFCRLCGKCEQACPNGVHKITEKGHFVEHSKCMHCGKCIDACPHSNRNSSHSALRLPTIRQEVSELFDTIRPQLDIVKGCGGITLSGGEALLQSEAVIELLTLCRNHQIKTCVETSMLLSKDVYEKTAKYVDCWLLGFRGVYLPAYTNATTVRSDCKKLIEIFRQWGNPHLIARLPIIKGYTDTIDKLHALRQILLENDIMELEVLPCNPHMNFYYELMGKEVSLDINQCIPDDREINSILAYFRHTGIQAAKVD